MEIVWTILFVVVSVIFLYVFFRTLRSLLLWIKTRGMGSPNKNPLVNDLLEIL